MNTTHAPPARCLACRHPVHEGRCRRCPCVTQRAPAPKATNATEPTRWDVRWYDENGRVLRHAAVAAPSWWAAREKFGRHFSLPPESPAMNAVALLAAHHLPEPPMSL